MWCKLKSENNPSPCPSEIFVSTPMSRGIGKQLTATLPGLAGWTERPDGLLSAEGEQAVRLLWQVRLACVTIPGREL